MLETQQVLTFVWFLCVYFCSLKRTETDTFVSGTIASMALFSYLFVAYDLKEGQNLARIKDYTDCNPFIFPI